MGESARLNLSDARATEALGAAVAQGIESMGRDSCLILLAGDLGVGKTTLVRGLLRSAGYAGPVPSPTYTLVEPYRFNGRRLYHLDLYRLADPEDLEYLGWREMEDALSIVEWPDRAPALHAMADLLIRMAHARAGRTVELTGLSAPGRVLLASTLEAMTDLN